jgi:hypothetical protein
MIKIPTNYVELNWLNKKDKDIRLPRLIETNSNDYGGCYYPPGKYEIMIDNKFIPGDRGIIIIAETNDNKFHTNSLVHEWRHHWQTNKGIELDGLNWFELKGSYEQKIVQYFTGSKSEMDALLFSNKISPDDTTLEWLEWIRKSKILLDKLI